MKSRRNHDEEFKKQAAKLSYESGKSISQVAEELGVAQSALYEWRALAKAGKTDPPPVGKNAKGSDVVDHIIVTKNSCFSFRDGNLI